MRFPIPILIMALMMTLTEGSVSAVYAGKDSPRYGGTLVWGTHTKPAPINPLFTTYSISASLEDLIFNKLVRLNTKGEIEPDLAERWTISSDGLTYTFYLRKGVRFHDGHECTAEDVKFTYDTILDERSDSSFRFRYQSIKETKIMDAYTFQIVLSELAPSFLFWLSRGIVPKHLLEGTDIRNVYFNHHPVGTGPFRFKEWAQDSQIKLEYNPDYYEGRPYLDEIVVKVYCDSSEMWVALMRGEIDYAGFIEQEDYEVVKTDAAFKTYAIQSDGYALVYNMRDPVLSDIRIRKAIAYGIDRDNLIRLAAKGYGLKSSGPFHPSSIGFNHEVKAFDYDPGEARRLLADAGWKDSDNDGILESGPDELIMTILLDARNRVNKRIVMVVRQQLQAIGIRVEVIEYADEKEITPELLTSNKVQAHLTCIFMGTYPAEIAMEWYSKQSKPECLMRSYNNPEVDALFEEGNTVTDPLIRRALYQKIHALIYQDQPACFLYFPFAFNAVHCRLLNADAFFSPSMPVYTIKDWYVHKHERR